GWHGHPRLTAASNLAKKTWVPGTRPGTGVRVEGDRLFRAEALAGADQALLRQVDRLGAVGDRVADDPGVPLMAPQDSQRGIGICFGDDHAEPDPHVVDRER